MGRSKIAILDFSGTVFQKFSVIESSELKQLYKMITGGDFIQWFANLFSEPKSAISSLRGYPIKPEILSYNDSYQKSIHIAGADRTLKNKPCLNMVYNREIVNYDIPDATSFIDYEPYTQMQLYLPFMDFIDLPVNEVRGKKLRVLYAIDLSTGNCTATIEVNNNVIAIKNAKIGVDIAWGSNNNMENTRNIINTALSTAISLTTIGLAPANPTTFAGDTIKGIAIGSSASKGALSVMNSFTTKFERGGSAGCISSMLLPNKPYLIIKKPKLVPVDETDYAHTYGKPLYESRVLAQVSGYTVIDEIHLTGLPDALDDEVNEIERLLKEGVHL